MFFPHHSASFSSRPSSRPVSRPASPTRSNTRSSINSTQSGSSSHPTPIPGHTNSFRLPSSNHGTPHIDTSDFDLYDTPPSSAGAVPAYGPYTPTSEMGWSSHLSSGANTPGGSFHHGHGSSTPGYGSLAHAAHHSLEIVLDSENLVMRGAGGDMNPAYLSGRLELDLAEKTNVKEVIMNLTGKAKVQFADNVGSKNHHHSHIVVTHDWSFLEGDKKHNHTLKAGHHSFPFQLMIDSGLPSSIQTFAGEASIQYKLRATVVRPGFTATNYLATKTFDLQRTYTPDALEFNQTLEIENTWPGKVMYSLTLPFKAYAAGDDIPVAVKFMPLAKGVKVTAVTSVLKEYTMVSTRHSSHNDTRVAAGCKHEFREGRAVQVSEETLRPPAHSAGKWSGVTIRRPSTNLAGIQNAVAGPSTAPVDPANMTDEEIAAAAASDVMRGDDEVNTFFSLYIPPWVTPTHTVHPVTVTHKLKWSCTITNPDGHISELRCALPIIILNHSLLEEARSAGANTRALLLGETVDHAQNVDLPSYSNHVYDRVAADSGPATGYTSRSSRTPTGTHTPATPTPPHSRPVSRPPSRPASPVRRDSVAHDPIPGNPPRRQLSFEADSELLRALGALEAHSISPTPSATPGGSRAPSRPLSRRGSFTRSGRSSNVNSRPGSRAASPDRSHPSSASGSLADDSHVRPGTDRRSTGLAARLHLPHSFKPLKPLSSRPILRNQSNGNLIDTESNVPRNASFPALSSNHTGSSSTSGSHVSFHPKTARHDGRRFFGGSGGGYFGSSSRSGSGSGVGFHLGPDQHLSGSPDGLDGADTPPDVDPISRVPGYDIARFGFASDLANGPPTYDSSNALKDEAERDEAIQRTRSDSALVDMVAREAEVQQGTSGAEVGAEAPH